MGTGRTRKTSRRWIYLHRGFCDLGDREMIPVIPTEAVNGGIELAVGFLAAMMAFFQYMFVARG